MVFARHRVVDIVVMCPFRSPYSLAKGLRFLFTPQEMLPQIVFPESPQAKSTCFAVAACVLRHMAHEYVFSSERLATCFASMCLSFGGSRMRNRDVPAEGRLTGELLLACAATFHAVCCAQCKECRAELRSADERCIDAIQRTES